MVLAPFLTYGNWDLVELPLPQRSRLYSLLPIGLGTPNVESLTGYTARLAQAHCVSFGDLIAHELTSLSKKPIGHSYLHQISGCTEVLNGTGQMAQEFLQAIERLTLRSDLRSLTLLPWAEVFPAKGLLHRARTWCPACYGEWQHQGYPIYEPLLWALATVTVCSRHQQPLFTLCPHCNRSLPLLSWHSCPGHCSKCHQWLGEAARTPEVEPFWVADNVAELLAYAADPAAVPARNWVARSFSIVISQTTQGNIAEFARQLGMPRNKVWQWQSGVAIPQLSVLLQVCSVLKVSLLDFLLDPAALETSPSIITSQPRVCIQPKTSFDTNRLYQGLEVALSQEPPLPLTAVARNLECSPRSLRRCFPDLCQAISARYLSRRKHNCRTKLEESCQEVRQIALRLYNDGTDPTRSCVAHYLSKPAYLREKSVLESLKSVRRELGLG